MRDGAVEAYRETFSGGPFCNKLKPPNTVRQVSERSSFNGIVVFLWPDPKFGFSLLVLLSGVNFEAQAGPFLKRGSDFFSSLFSLSPSLSLSFSSVGLVPLKTLHAQSINNFFEMSTKCYPYPQ